MFKRFLALLLSLVLIGCCLSVSVAELPPEQQHDEESPYDGMHSPTVSNGTGMYVYTSNGKTLHLRQKASSTGKILREIPWGAKVNVLKTSGSWAKITYDGTTGYVVKKYLVSRRPTRRPAARPKKTAPPVTATPVPKNLDSKPLQKLDLSYDATVDPAGEDSILFKKASVSSQILQRLPEGSPVVVLAVNDDWAQVYDGVHDKEGYMLLADLVADLMEEEDLEEEEL